LEPTNHIQCLTKYCATVTQLLRIVLLNTERDWLAPKEIANHI